MTETFKIMTRSTTRKMVITQMYLFERQDSRANKEYICDIYIICFKYTSIYKTEHKTSAGFRTSANCEVHPYKHVQCFGVYGIFDFPAPLIFKILQDGLILR